MTQQQDTASSTEDDVIDVTTDTKIYFTPEAMKGKTWQKGKKEPFCFRPVEYLQKTAFRRALKAGRLQQHGLADRYRRCRVLAEATDDKSSANYERTIEVLDAMEQWLQAVQDFSLRKAIGDAVREDEVPTLASDIHRDYATILQQYESYDPVLNSMDIDDEEFQGKGYFMAVRYAQPDWEGVDVERVLSDAALTHDCVRALAQAIGDVAFQELAQYCMRHLQFSAVTEKK